jgi:hypothetical protein
MTYLNNLLRMVVVCATETSIVMRSGQPIVGCTDAPTANAVPFATVAGLPVSSSRDSVSERQVMTIAFKPFALTIAALVTLIGAAPAFAEQRSCAEIASLRSGAAETTATIEVTNRRSIPSTIELVDGSGKIADYVRLAPGETREIRTYRTHAWISRDARRLCLSGFVSEELSEKWEITPTVDGDYERRNVRSFPVYIAPEFRGHASLLERSLEVLDANARRIEDIIPAAAWHRISRTPIWLEYEPDRSYAGQYLPDSPAWLAAYDISIAKAGSMQFTSSLAAMTGLQVNPLLHELAHAYHDLVLSFDDPRIRMAFDRAQASGRYNAVRDLHGRWARAYSISNPMEFFASLSETYFGTNDYFPFTQDDLKAFDPDSYRVISEAWERPPEKTPRWPVRSPIQWQRSPG